MKHKSKHLISKSRRGTACINAKFQVSVQINKVLLCNEK